MHSELSGCWWWRNLFEGLHYDACCVVVIYLNVFKSPLLNPQFCFYLHRLYYSWSQLSPFYSAHVDRCICYPADLLKFLFISSVAHEILFAVIYDRCFSLLLPFFSMLRLFWEMLSKVLKNGTWKSCSSSFSDKLNMLTNTACRLRGHLRIMFVRANSEFQIPDCYFVLINVRDFAWIIISSHHRQQPSTCWGWGKTRYLYPGAIGDGTQHFARRHVSVEVEAGLQPDHSLFNSAHQSCQPPKESIFNQN